ncbi:hypothetical protein PUN28_008562 [Cardiocondyla obscurior]|uniref:Uncharacterized protein n=1 Tax=Cardiocondyla obscurior TaxID=286306 RepID=A0AAW2G058_9HYME
MPPDAPRDKIYTCPDKKVQPRAFIKVLPDTKGLSLRTYVILERGPRESKESPFSFPPSPLYLTKWLLSARPERQKNNALRREIVGFSRTRT